MKFVYDEASPTVIFSMTSSVKFYTMADAISRKLDLKFVRMKDYVMKNDKSCVKNGQLDLVATVEPEQLNFPMYYAASKDGHIGYILLQDVVNGTYMFNNIEDDEAFKSLLKYNAHFLLIVNNIPESNTELLLEMLNSVDVMDNVNIFSEKNLKHGRKIVCNADVVFEMISSIMEKY